MLLRASSCPCLQLPGHATLHPVRCMRSPMHRAACQACPGYCRHRRRHPPPAATSPLLGLRLAAAKHAVTAPAPDLHFAAVGLAPPQRTTAEVDAVVREFHEALARSSDMAVSCCCVLAAVYIASKKINRCSDMAVSPASCP